MTTFYTRCAKGHGGRIVLRGRCSRSWLAAATSYHAFWPCDLSLLDEAQFDRSRLHGLHQVTDAYLLALALANKGRFVTFDRSVPLAAVRGATLEHLTVL